MMIYTIYVYMHEIHVSGCLLCRWMLRRGLPFSSGPSTVARFFSGYGVSEHQAGPSRASVGAAARW